MKFNRKIRFKVLSIMLILAFIIIFPTALTTSPNQLTSKCSQKDEEISNSAPITPQYKYHYENDFDFYLYSGDSVFYIAPLGYNTEWSQDPNDDLSLDIWFANTFYSNLEPFSMSASLYVVSNNTFQKQGDYNLGAYIEFHIDIDELLRQEPIDVRSIDLILMILKPDGNNFIPIQLVNIYNLEPQTGRFYISNFDQYIYDGRVRFALMGLTYGFVPIFPPFSQGGISLLVKFEGLRVIQEIKPKEQETERRTLIFVHGFGMNPCTPANWDTFYTLDFLSAYDDIIIVNYVGSFYVFRYSKKVDGNWSDYVIIDMNTTILLTHSIGHIANVLQNYIAFDADHIEDNVDFICHSMGGLVTRYMIKYMYDGLRLYYAAPPRNRNFTIENIAMLATPNHGVWLVPDIFPPSQQIDEMAPNSPFLNDLNDITDPTTEIPWPGREIRWFTYRSGVRNTLGTRWDGMVAQDSVPIKGATNKGLYQLDHEIMRQNDMLKTIIYNDIFRPPSVMNRTFDEGIPGIIMNIENLTLQPNYEEPGGKTLLSITYPPEDKDNISTTSVMLQISSSDYEMTLRSGTDDIYEVELPLVDGDYPFMIIADLKSQDGRLYQISGELSILDDDAKPPEIEITPGDTLISDEAAIGGVSVEWEISDYSGISEAEVELNGVKIDSYTDQSLITDSYLLSNEPGVYTISVWARDNDNDPSHDPPGGDRLEESSESTITIYDDDSSHPNIYSPPGGDISISDEDAAGGVLVSWEISDESGISEARIELNGGEIFSYSNVASISDSYLIPNEIGVYDIFIWAKDGDNDSEDDWLEHSIERTITIYDDDLNPPEIEITPGDLTISVEEAEGGILVVWEISDYSGILEANVLLNGSQIRTYENFGTVIDSYHLANIPGVYNFSIWAKDNDNDLEDDWLDYSKMITITIYEEDEEPPPPEIPGYNIFVLLGIFSVVIILLSKKKTKS